MTFRDTKTTLLLILLCILPFLILAQKPTVIANQQGHIKRIIGMDLSPDHRLLVTIGMDQQIILWNYSTTQLLRRIQHPVDLKEVWFRDKETLAVLDQKGQVHFWNVNTGQSIKTIGSATEEMLDYALGKDRQLLAVRKKNGKLATWNLDTGSKTWEVDGPAKEGILHFDKTSQSIFVRDKLGEVMANFKVTDGSMGNGNDFFNLVVLPPNQEDPSYLEKDKVIYQNGDDIQVVEFSRELTTTFSNQEQAKAAGLTPATEGMIRGVLGVRDFAYSADGSELFLARYEWAMWSTGVTHRISSYAISRWNLQTDAAASMPKENYFVEFMHLSRDGKFLITADDSHSFHFRDVANLQNISRKVAQPEVFHTRTIISEDISQIGIHKFDINKVRTLDLQNRSPWTIGGEHNSLSRGKQPYLKKFSAYNINSAIAAHTKPIILMNLRNIPFAAPVVGGPLDYLALLDQDENLQKTYNFYADEIDLSPDERYGICTWYLKEEDRSFGGGVLNIYGDSRRHGPYQLSIWDYQAGELIKSEESWYSDVYPGVFLKTQSGIDRFQAIHFSGSQISTIHVVDKRKTEYWNLNAGNRLGQKTWNQDVLGIDFLSDGQRAVSTLADGSLVLWKTLDGQEIQRWDNIGKFYTVKVSANNRYVTLRNKGKTGFFDLQKGKLVIETGEDRPAETTMFGLDGDYIGRHMGEVGEVQVNAKKHQAVTAHYDGTITFWDLDKGEELASLYSIDSINWVAVSPSGLFDATPGVMDLLYFVIGTEVVELEQLKERYFEPGLLQKLLGYSTERLRPVENLGQVPLYPRIKEETKIKNNILHVELEERNGGIGPVSIFINGKEVTADANPASGGKRPAVFELDIKPHSRLLLKDPSKKNVLTIRAYNEEGWLKSAAYDLEFSYEIVNSRGIADFDTPEEIRLIHAPKLYAVCIGTSEYTGDELDLRYADQDARSIATAINASGAALFSARGDSVEVHCLTTDPEKKVEATIDWQYANKKNIQTVFESIAAKAKAEDILVVYLSGHGVTYGNAEEAQFYYLTHGISSEDLSDTHTRETYTLSGEEITKMINDVPALKQVLMIDACNSGQIVTSLTEGRKSLNSGQIRALDRMKDRTGMFVISGSAANKVSYEASQYGQGLLTFSLLQGMQLVSAKQSDNHLDVMSLFQHSRNQVPDLAKGIGGIQRPVLAFPNNASSFDIGIVNDAVKIPIANEKPVFIRNVFLESKAYDDVIGLGDALSKYFHSVSSKGAQAEYIFVDVNQFDNAYSLKGIYTLNGNNVKVKGALFKGKKNVGTFDLTGSKDDIDTLVDDLIWEVEGLLE